MIEKYFGRVRGALIALLLCCVLLTSCTWEIPSFGNHEIPSTAQETEFTAAEDTIEIPPYSGQDCVILNGNRPRFSESELAAEPHVIFSAFDALGRTGAGNALLGPETLPTEARGQIGDIRPPGWHTVRYDDLIEDRYLYNRSHVIGYLLCGDNATPENLFTGTRYLNATTMLQFELQVARYIESTGNHVAYRVTPTYEGDDLVAFGVQIEAMSVEDAGKNLSLNVFVYNIQPGIVIDYRTGDSERDPNYESDHAAVLILEEAETDGREADRSASEDAEAFGLEEERDAEAQQEPTYVLNTSSKKFHLPTCKGVADMSAKNRQDFFGTREEAIAEGYDPCGTCKP